MEPGWAESLDIWDSVTRKEPPDPLDAERTLKAAGFDFRARPVVGRRFVR